MDEYLNCEMEMGKCNRKVIERIGKKIKWERRERPKLKGKKIKWGKKGKGRRKGNKNKGKGKRRQRREGQGKGSDDWTEKVAKLRRKGR